MALYNRVDIALDPIPLNSGTTGFDALWMGVPLVTLEGDWLGGRLGKAMLTALGHPEWVAHSEAEYVEKVVNLARDIDLRRHLRFAQRATMRQSPLCDGEGLAHSLEDAFETMYDLWFAKPAA
jgi:predicted O-linked N-acetylglucosamine transferase (SPINDLY family)